MTREQTQFKPGSTGNPTGRPRGSRNHKNRLLDDIMTSDDNARQIIETLVSKAQQGDTHAAEILLKRYQPIPRSSLQAVEFDLDPSASPLQQCRQILAAVAAGELAPDVGQILISAVTALCRAGELVELEQRIAELEEAHKNG